LERRRDGRGEQVVRRHLRQPALQRAVLVEMAFIDYLPEARLLTEKADVFARAIARGVTDYEAEMQAGESRASAISE
ncbi:MAG: hypothetical protein ACFNMA_10925, partial [Treponema socranskii subsp. buccale]